MSLFAIGDTHLSFGTQKPMDIFSGWENFEEKLKNNWERIVCDSDTVVIPGDITWGMSLEESLEDFKFIDSLPGEKIILKGNHDYWWSTKRKAELFFQINNINSIKILNNNAYKIGDFAVCGTRGWAIDGSSELDKKILLREAGRLRASIEQASKLGGEKVAFLHYPPVTNDSFCEEICSELVKGGLKRCYYGHLHGASTAYSFNGEMFGIEFKLVSADYLKFCPKLIPCGA